MMKARQYDRRFFSRQIQPNVYAIQESNGIDRYTLEYFCNGDSKLKVAMDSIITEMHDAKEYGSILNITPVDFAALYARFDEVRDDISMSKESVLNNLLPLVQVAEALAQKYDVSVTNPPYMGSGNMGAKLLKYVKAYYPETSSDMSTVFMEKCNKFTKVNGFISMINIPVWMYLSSYVDFRARLLTSTTVSSLLYFGRGVFGSDFGTTAFVILNSYIKQYIGLYKKLFERKVEVEPLEVKERKFFDDDGVYVNKQDNFWKVSGNPYAYNMTPNMQRTFEVGKIIDSIASPRQGMATGNNDKFLRLWYEVCREDMVADCSSVEAFHETGKLYAPYNKGGAYRKWYGNQDYVIKFNKQNYDILATVGNHLPSRQYYFNHSLTWSKVTMGGFSMRYMPDGFVFDVSGCSLFASDTLLYPLLGFLNSKIAAVYFGFFSPTVNYEVGNIKAMPFIRQNEEVLTEIVQENIKMAKCDWDAYETSWNYKRHPLIRSVSTVADAFAQWEAECDQRFVQLKANEEEMNRIFIDIYGLQDELTPEVEDKDVTVRKADLQRDIKSLISYAVGCMFGRYSPLKDGLLYAGGDWDYTAIQQALMDAIGKNEFSSDDMVWDANFIDKDNIIPICDDEYFDDDIVGRFVKFIEAVYGKDTLEENLKVIADALGGKSQPREVIRNYFLNDFYADHCKIYQKRPIYWLFDSGKKNGFKALIYMHRYQPDTIARIRTDYVHEQQSRYRTAIADMENRIANASTSERVKLNKVLTKLKDQDAELRSYEEKIHHLADQMIAIDLDDGVKVNYAKFQDVLAKIK